MTRRFGWNATQRGSHGISRGVGLGIGRVALGVLVLVASLPPVWAGLDRPTPAVAQEREVRTAHLVAFAENADCQASLNGTTRYFVTLVSSTGANIPAQNGGTPATVTLIGAGTQNQGQTVPLFVGDLESQAQDGRDLGNGLGGGPDGDCNDPEDLPPQPVDGHANDYGSPFVATSPPSGAGAGQNTWRLHIVAPGHEARLLDIQALVDGIPPTSQFPGTGCLNSNRGCLISLGTITLPALPVPPAGFGTVGGLVTDAAGLPLGGVLVVLVRHSDGQARSVLTNSAGQYVFEALTPGGYSVTVADTRFPLSCAPSTGCGVQPGSKLAEVRASDVLTVNFSVPVDMSTKQAPGTPVTPGQVGVFGYVADGGTGYRFASVSVTFTPPPGSGVPQVVQTTDSTGRYQAILAAGVAYAAVVTLPTGYVAACTVRPATQPTLPCGQGADGADRFTVPATIPGGTWNDGASFLLLTGGPPAIPPPGHTLVRQLEGAVAGIFRNPDLSFTGVDVEHVELRVKNLGPFRTGVQVEWYHTDSSGIAALVKTDTLDVNPGTDPDPLQSTAVFTRDFVPDGCTRCYAEIYSIDIDGPAPVYGKTHLQATLAQRVPAAGNAVATANVPGYQELFPATPNPSDTWVVPQVFTNYQDALPARSSLVTACLTRATPSARPLIFQFTPLTGGTPIVVSLPTNPGGCQVLNLATGGPGFAPLPNGAYALAVTNLGGPFLSVLTYSIPGHTAQLTNGTPATPPIPTPTPTRVPTPTLPAVSGHSFTLQSGGVAPLSGPVRGQAAVADRLLSWQPGALGSAVVLRYHPPTTFDFLPSPLNPLPPGVGSYRDSEPLAAESPYCYLLMTYLGDLSSPTVRGLSDLLCVYPGTSTGVAPPGQFRIRLNETTTATLTWSPPGGQDRYVLTRTRFDASAPQPIPLPANQTTFSEDMGPQPACYQLTAFAGETLVGTTDMLCAAPNNFAFPETVAAPGDAGRDVATALDHVRRGAPRGR